MNAKQKKALREIGMFLKEYPVYFVILVFGAAILTPLLLASSIVIRFLWEVAAFGWNLL